jgi:hypothetical protein
MIGKSQWDFGKSSKKKTRENISKKSAEKNPQIP